MEVMPKIYPTALSEEEFDRDWKIDSYHGTPQSYGLHDGWDINLKTGGDSDLGKPIYAIADYELVYYHLKSHLEAGFGVHIVYKIETTNGTRWIHCAHLLPDPPIMQNKTGKKGDTIGYIGATGRPRGQMLTHLHFAVFKKDPKEHPKGIDNIANTKAELDEWWEDPTITLQSIKEPLPEEPQENKDLDKEKELHEITRDELRNTRKELEETKSEVEKYKEESKTRKQDYEGLLTDISKKLFLPDTSDRADVMGSIERLLDKEDKLNEVLKEKEQEEKKHALEKDELKIQIQQLRSEIERQQKQNETLLQRTEELETKMRQIESAETVLKESSNRFIQWLNGLLGK